MPFNSPLIDISYCILLFTVAKNADEFNREAALKSKHFR